MLTMVREFLLILLVASLAAAAISVVFLGFAKWADMVRVERESLAAASTDFSYQMVTHEIGIGDWKLRRVCVVDNKRVVDSKRMVANVNMHTTANLPLSDARLAKAPSSDTRQGRK